MIYQLLILIQIAYSVLFFNKQVLSNGPVVLGESTQTESSEVKEEDPLFSSVPSAIDLETETAFDQKEVEESVAIEFETKYVDDEDLEYGKEETVSVGINGSEISTYLVTHWLDEEIDRILIASEIIDPTTEVISIGKKIVWKELETSDLGKIDYWGKLNVFATKYDHTCIGCNNTTALGAPVIEGVCAVDPKVIPMYTHFYVPGYGKCQALDVGGLIKGNRIDLAFRDAHSAAWGAEYVNIYLMDNEPTFEDEEE